MSIRLITVLLVAASATACAHRPTYDPADPLEPVNRKIFAFNNTVDRYVAEPVARTYVKVVPSPVRVGLGNFLDNLSYPVVIVNSLLQLKLAQATHDTGRFLFNTTVGLAGFLDPASDIGLTANNEDLGQTLGTWGVGEGWYLVLPFLGPTTNRDLVGRIGDGFTTPLFYLEGPYQNETRITLLALGILDARAGLLGSEKLMAEQFDPYVFLRSAYLERRWNLQHDGNPPVEEIDYDALLAE
mgnify:CR=1 FL=1|jgi:phospholipid-binding lipoprotein MlaA